MPTLPAVQPPIGDLALLADSRTAALIDAAGGVAWCCWPRFDSDPLFMPLLDEASGGVFRVRPAHDATVVSREYVDSSLVLRTVWRQGAQLLITHDALLLESESTLFRSLRSEGGPISIEVAVRPATQDGAAPRMSVHDCWLVLDGAVRVVITCPGAWSIDGDIARCEFVAQPGTTAYVAMSSADAMRGDADNAIDDTVARWRERTAPALSAPLRFDAEGALGGARCRRLVQVAACVLSGLRFDRGGIVSAPTTSLPQWPHSARCWDYRYCWLRDASLAGEAMVRLGMLDTACALGDFIAGVVLDGGLRPVVRVDGGAAPPERVAKGLDGYRGARQVRFGNAAADQLQVDVAGEVLELAAALAAAGTLPDSLAGAVAPLVAWIEDHWDTPDHGIWEIRGTPRRYTHSHVMAWVGLDRAARLGETGRIDGEPDSWRALASHVRVATTSMSTGAGPALQLYGPDGGADAALSVALTNGFLVPHGDPAAATLDLIAHDLDDAGLVQRYRGSRDQLPDPCAPFVFPTFWLASAQGAAGRDGAPWLQAATAAGSRLGLYGEVRDPDSGGPLGNFPHVQSHAALVNALTEAPDTVSRRW